MFLSEKDHCIENQNDEGREKMSEVLFESLDLGFNIYHTRMPGHTPGPGRVFSSLIVGSEKALLIDTGYGIGDYRAYVETLTDKPLIVANTHGHIDHASGNCQFDEVWMNPKDYALADWHTSLETRRNSKDIGDYVDRLVDGPYKRLPLEEGVVFDLGDRTVTAYNCAGHTKGSMSFLDSKSRYLFTGDNITRRVLLLSGITSTTLEEFRQTLLHTKKLSFDHIVAAHVPYLMQPEWIDKVLDIVENFDPRKGIVPPRNFALKMPGSLPTEYTVGDGFDDPEYCGFVYDGNHLEEFLQGFALKQ